MKNLMVGVFVALAAEVVFADSLYRVKLNGGEWENKDDFGSVMAIAVAATTETLEVELMADDLTTFNATYTFAAASSPRTITFRSNSDGDTIYTLQRAANNARFYFSANDTTALVFESITIDGGSLAGYNVERRKPFVEFNCANATHSATFGSGCTLRNFDLSVSDYGMIRSVLQYGTVSFLDGSLLENCNGNVIFNLRTADRFGCGLTVSGGTFRNCSVPALFDLQVKTDKGSPGCWCFSGGYITNNTITGNGAVLVGTLNKVRFSGAPVIARNFKQDGSLANVYALTADNVLLEGSLSDEAEVGLTSAVAADAGEVFGKADDISFTGADRIVFDGNDETKNLRGAIDAEGNLVWKAGTLSKITYEAEGFADIEDGAAHSGTVTVIAPEEHVLTYATAQAGPYSAEKPSFFTPGAHQLWYRIEADGCEAVNGFVEVVIDSYETARTHMYRVRRDGKSIWRYRETFAEALAEIGDGETANLEIEMLNDDDRTFNALIAMTNVTGAAIADARKVVVRSYPTDGLRRTLTRASSDAEIQFPLVDAKFQDLELVFTNIVVDGGAMSSCSVLRRHALFRFECNYVKNSLTFEDGCVLRNFSGANENYGLIRECLQYGTVAIRPGALIENVSDCPLVSSNSRNNYSIDMTGGTIRNCSNAGGALFALDMRSGRSEVPGEWRFTGGWITNNAVKAGSQVFRVGPDNKLQFGGSAVVKDNFDANGEKANVWALGPTNLCLCSEMSGGAYVGCSTSAQAAQGVVFGFATRSDLKASAKAFHFDGKRNLSGKLNALPNERGTYDLSWVAPGLVLIVR